jgi:hypothetical protein
MWSRELERVLGVGGGLEQSSPRAGERVAHTLVLRWIRDPRELVGFADRGDAPLDRRDRARIPLVTRPLVGSRFSRDERHDEERVDGQSVGLTAVAQVAEQDA